MTFSVDTLTEKVKTNLIYYNLWSNVEVFELGQWQAIRACPPENKPKEWVLPIDVKEKITMNELDQVFEHIRRVENRRPEKILFGIYNDDATIMYYTVHDGLVKPKQS